MASHFSDRAGRATLGIPLVLLGGLSAMTAYRRWRMAEDAIRAGRPLPGTNVIAVIGGGVAVVALLGIVLTLVAVS